ncbi:MAG: universal stress protein [Comamonadaceae bacterium]|nr:MAG: universal stress protein [Comamonadaceae bacterium]
MRFSTAGVRLHAEGDPFRLNASVPVAATPRPDARMPIRSIVVATDLSSHEHIAVHRAAQLAAAHGATLRVVYLPARRDVRPLSEAGLAAAASQMQTALALALEVAPMRAASVDELGVLAKAADLLVVPHRRERSTAAFFRGQPVVRLLRACRCPVLVVRALRSRRYARVLVAVDLSPASHALVKVAAHLEPQAELEIFNALDTLNEARLRSAEATEAAVRAYRQRCLEEARDRMVAFTDSFDARRNRFLTTIGRGDPGSQAVVQQERSGADLVVVGKRTATAWEDFLCGSVAHRVLSWGSSDVLVVPQAHVEATAPIAMRRMRGAHA